MANFETFRLRLGHSFHQAETCLFLKCDDALFYLKSFFRSGRNFFLKNVDFYLCGFRATSYTYVYETSFFDKFQRF